MIPLSDDNSARIRTPYINIALIILNIFVYVYYQGFGSNYLFTASFATIPNEILTGVDVVYKDNVGVTPYTVYITLFTAMFMHGSLAHLGGNLLYLWVFGDNLENRMGHLKYLLFYLLTGLIATFCHVGLCYLLQKDLYTPSLGASGAISGVLGGYLLLFPKNQVKVLFIAFIFRVPAFITLGLWIGLQLMNGWGSLGNAEGGGGVAYAAHIGGFVAGMLLVRYFISSSGPTELNRKNKYERYVNYKR